MARHRNWLLSIVVLLAALRLPLLALPFSNDEGGYAYVARWWDVGSGGIYGAQWVDRPPALFALYAIALELGGDLAVRVLGLCAAAVSVVLCALVAGRVAGAPAGRRAGLLAALLLSSPLLQAQAVNAELLALPFVLASIAWTVHVLGERGDARWAIAAGAAAMVAVLVKQSFIDGFVFAAAALAATAAIRGRGAFAMRGLAGGAAGAGLVLCASAAWAQLQGPGFDVLVDALYGFRIEARSVIDAYPNAPKERAVLLLGVVGATGLATLLAAIVVRPSLEPVQLGILALAAWAAVAVVAGGNWWLHYLVQLVPACAIGGALATSRVAWFARRQVAAVLIAAWLAALVGQVLAPHGMHAGHVGGWVARQARPGDTALVLWGAPHVLHHTGLRSPYPLSWSLPVRVRDPQLAQLVALLEGSDAPRWVVVWGSIDSWGLDRHGRLRSVLDERYEVAGHPEGRPVYRLRPSAAWRPAPARVGSKGT